MSDDKLVVGKIEQLTESIPAKKLERVMSPDEMNDRIQKYIDGLRPKKEFRKEPYLEYESFNRDPINPWHRIQELYDENQRLRKAIQQHRMDHPDEPAAHDRKLWSSIGMPGEPGFVNK